MVGPHLSIAMALAARADLPRNVVAGDAAASVTCQGLMDDATLVVPCGQSFELRAEKGRLDLLTIVLRMYRQPCRVPSASCIAIFEVAGQSSRKLAAELVTETRELSKQFHNPRPPLPSALFSTLQWRAL